ncbi:MAG: sugar phosphate isomerase/epimerase family protein [Chloroflexota bacterium]
MQFGCCAPINNAAVVHAAGFDYIEAAVKALIPDEDDEAFLPILAQHQSSPVPVQAFNLFLPGDLKIVGDNVDEARMNQYVKRAAARIRQIGATTAVVGSGGSRRIPDGFSRDAAVEQIVHFFQVLADETDDTELTIVIEPLNKKESNVINSVAEGVEIAQKVDRPSIKVLADFYHMDEDDEPLSEISKYKDWLSHIHVADTGRGAPGTGQYPYDTFVGELRSAGYDGMVSIECRWNDFEAEAKPAVEFLRRVMG